MTAELFLLGIAFPDATELTGDVLLFVLLAPLQFPLVSLECLLLKFVCHCTESDDDAT